MDNRMLLIQLPGYGLQTASSVYALQEEGVDILDLNLDLTRQICGDGYRLATDDDSLSKLCGHVVDFKSRVKRLHDFDAFSGFVSPHAGKIRGYKLFGVSLNGDWLKPLAVNMAAFIRGIRPDATIAVGGALILDYYPEIAPSLLDAGFDIVVFGDGRSQVRELLSSGDVERCFSSVFSRNGTPWITSRKEALLGMPRFHPNISLYPYPQILTVPINMGCYYGRCSFCAERSYSGSSAYYKFPNEEIISALRHMHASGVPFVWLGGSGIRKEELRGLLKELNACGDGIPKYGLESRAIAIDEELAGLLKRSRCSKISFGLECPDEHICNQIYNKGIDIPGFLAGLRHLEQAGYQRVSINIVISSLFHDGAKLDDIAGFLNSYDCVTDYVLYLLSVTQGRSIETIAAGRLEKPMAKPLGPEHMFWPEGEAEWFKGAMRYLAAQVEKPFGVFMDENTSLQLWSLVEDDQIPDFRRRFYRAQLSISNADFKPNKPVWR